MDQIGTLQLILEKADRTFHMLLPIGTPLEDALDVALQFVDEIRTIQKNQAAAQAAAQAAQASQAETPPTNPDPSDASEG